MIQEILVALSGHHSVLFLDRDTSDTDASLVNPDIKDLATSEIALLQVVGQIALYHRLLKKQLNVIVSSHPSLICRAVAASLLHTHLRRFQDHILALESRILTEDAAVVGAYRNVPLSVLVTEVNPWQRLLRWYWSITTFIQPNRSDHAADTASQKLADAASLINRLRREAETGFEDVESAAIELSRVAERAWLKLASTWLLYGRLPQHGAADLFIGIDTGQDGQSRDSHFVDPQKLPCFVEEHTAASILFIGRTLSQLHASQTADHHAYRLQEETPDLSSAHLEILSSLAYPIASNALNRAIAQIRKSLSQNLLQLLLPAEEVTLILDVLRQFFLLGRGEFAVLLIEEAGRTAKDKKKILAQESSDLVSNLRNMNVRDGDLFETSSKVWRSLMNLSNNEDDDDFLDRARRIIRLEVASDKRDPYQKVDLNQSNPASKFEDVLFPAVKTHLTMTIQQPIDLFLSPDDLKSYSSMQNYLLSLRKAQLQLSSLWRHSTARRDPSRHSSSQSLASDPSLRKLWATCSSALFLLSELLAYFEGEIITLAWARFTEWTRHPSSSSPRDPETLAIAHRYLVKLLLHAVLLDDAALTTELRALIAHADALVLLFDRLVAVSGTEAGAQSMYLDLDRARKRADAAMKAVVRRLRALDRDRAPETTQAEMNEVPDMPREGWIPASTGVHRLLMKLDFGRVDDDEESV
ncbi:hypothetical protein ANO11243_065830 [Dothideomycetidae sp. 11243]|nr:hypothetical protein ANO11243_065830 [fungal sp. No.11243]